MKKTRFFIEFIDMYVNYSTTSVSIDKSKIRKD